MAEKNKENKNKKINKMSMEEIDKAISETKEKMGSLSSKYAAELLKQKEILLASKK